MKWVLAAGNFFFKYRDLVFPAVFIVLALALAPALAGGDARVDHYLDALGIGIAAAGQALRAAVIGFAYIKRGGRNKRIYADNLVQEGFFAHCRNPLYVGNFLILMGLIVIHNSPWIYAIAVPFFVLAYLAIVLAEEKYLRGHFGAAYEDYCRRVNRFVPSFKGLSKSLAGMSFDWRRVIRKDYGTMFTWTSCAVGLLALQAVRDRGFEDQKQYVFALAGAWGVIVLAWLAARVLKKTDMLGVG